MIKMNDFSSMPFAYQSAIEQALVEVAQSGRLILGNKVDEFQRRFAVWSSVPNVVGVGNGLDALVLGLTALGIGPGDEVITSPMTAYATVLAIHRVGAIPVLADIDPGTGLLSVESVTRCITPSVKAIIVVHLYGQLGNMGSWVDLCKREGILLIEDCAQSHGAQTDSRGCGSFGSFGAFSFYPTKNLGALGDAGAFVSVDSTLATTVAKLRNYGQKDRYFHDLAGFNSRLDEIQAAVLLVKLEWIDQLTARRRAIGKRYHQMISSDFVSPLAPPQSDESHVYHLFVVVTPHRRRLIEHLTAAGIEVLIHYPVPAHLQPALEKLRTDPDGLPFAENHAETCVSLPCHPGLLDSDVDKIAEAVNSFRP
jgi:dTDP-4-amino-4,6-dideoxygalactose transaminase